jgi:hypothetical protein
MTPRRKRVNRRTRNPLRRCRGATLFQTSRKSRSPRSGLKPTRQVVSPTPSHGQGASNQGRRSHVARERHPGGKPQTATHPCCEFHGGNARMLIGRFVSTARSWDAGQRIGVKRMKVGGHKTCLQGFRVGSGARSRRMQERLRLTTSHTPADLTRFAFLQFID